MAGFEVIVRPVVFPNIRPAPPRSILPQDDPEQGVAVLGGAGGALIDLTQSESGSTSNSKPVETKRRFDTLRIYQMSDLPGSTRTGGEVNRENYIDVEAVNKVWMRSGNGTTTSYRYADIEESENIEILKRNQTRYR